MSERWLRLYEGVVNDPKLQRLSGETFKGLINLWCIASANGGALPSVEDMAFTLRMTEGKVAALVETLTAAGLLDSDETGIRPHNWNGRQYKSDVSTARVKRHRERKSAAACNADETLHETPPETETETETEQKTEARNNNNPPSLVEGGAVEPIASQGQGDEPEPTTDDIPANLDRRPYPEAFEALWAVYRPIAAKNATKADACAAWRILSEPDKAACLAGLRLYVAWMGEEAQRRAGTKAKHLATFIEKRGWEPFTEAQPSAKAATLWVANDDARWPSLAERWRTERGKPPPAVAASQGHVGQGWYFPAEWQAH